MGKCGTNVCVGRGRLCPPIFEGTTPNMNIIQIYLKNDEIKIYFIRRDLKMLNLKNKRNGVTLIALVVTMVVH